MGFISQKALLPHHCPPSEQFSLAANSHFLLLVIGSFSNF